MVGSVGTSVRSENPGWGPCEEGRTDQCTVPGPVPCKWNVICMNKAELGLLHKMHSWHYTLGGSWKYGECEKFLSMANHLEHYLYQIYYY